MKEGFEVQNVSRFDISFPIEQGIQISYNLDKSSEHEKSVYSYLSDHLIGGCPDAEIYNQKYA